MTDAPRLRGVLAAALTAFKDNLSIDADATMAHARWLLNNGCDGVLLFGTTGEGNSLSAAERLDFMDVLATSDLPMDKLMMGTGCCSFPETVALTQKSLEIGIDSVLMLPPFYYKSPSDDGLFAHFARVVDDVAAAQARFYLYHFPQMSAVPFSHDLIGRLMAAYPSQICGLKDSSGDFDNMQAMAEKFPGFDVFAGTERYLLDMLRAGGAGTITATGNVTSRLCGEVYANWQGSDADRLQDKLTEQRLTLQNYPAAAGLKELLARESRRNDWRNLRPPFMPLAQDKADQLAADMAAIDFSLPKMAA